MYRRSIALVLGSRVESMHVRADTHRPEIQDKSRVQCTLTAPCPLEDSSQTVFYKSNICQNAMECSYRGQTCIQSMFIPHTVKYVYTFTYACTHTTFAFMEINHPYIVLNRPAMFFLTYNQFPWQNIGNDSCSLIYNELQSLLLLFSS